MKNFAQNISFFKALSVCMIFSGFGINVMKCEASALEEFQVGLVEDTDKELASSSTTIVVPPIDVAIDIPIPKPLALNPIVIPDLNGQNFWSELTSLREVDETRYSKMLEGQEAFIAVTDLASMFEDYNYGGVNLRQVLSEEGCKLKLTLRNQDYEIQEYNGMPASQVLLGAIDKWPILQTSFFSQNQTIDLLRGRIFEVYENEHQLISQLVIARKKAANWKLKYQTLKKKIQENESVETPNEEVQRLKARVAQLEREAAERDAPPIANHVVVLSKESFSLWRWLKSLFQRAPKEPDETTRLINSDTEKEV